MERVRGSQRDLELRSAGRSCRPGGTRRGSCSTEYVRGREASEAGDPSVCWYSKLQSFIHSAMEVLMGPFKEEVPGPDPPVKSHG